MAFYPKTSLASVIALAIGLTACDGGTGVAFIPTPPTPAPTPSPTPSPTPTPTPAGVVRAPAPGAVPNANLFPIATVGGSTIQAHPGTIFPLLETVALFDSNGMSADTAATAGGAYFSASPTNDHFNLSVPGAGYVNVSLVAGGYYCYGFCGANIELDPETSKLSWTTYGSWGAYGTATSRIGHYVTGFATPVASVPTTGSATYKGNVAGNVWRPEAGPQFGIEGVYLSGDATVQANFGTGALTGSLTNMYANGVPWNSVSLAGTISGGQNSFSGTSAVISTAAGGYLLTSSATGTFSGLFFGPNAQELGAVWTLFDGTRAASGTIGAKVGP